MSDTEIEPQEPQEPVEAPLPPEPVEPDEEPEEEPEAPEATPAPPAEPSEQEAQMSKRFDASQKAFKSYTTRLGSIFQEDALSQMPCPLCPDMHKGFIDVRDAGNVPEEIKSVVMEYMGFARPIDLRPDPLTRTCGVCDGEGRTATGSHVQGNDSRTCPECRGYGYLPPPAENTNGVGRAADFHAPVGEHTAPLEEPEVDVAGEPKLLPDGRLNPNYGKWPQYKVVVPPWGVTAGLTVQDALS